MSQPKVRPPVPPRLGTREVSNGPVRPPPVPPPSPPTPPLPPPLPSTHSPPTQPPPSPPSPPSPLSPAPPLPSSPAPQLPSSPAPPLPPSPAPEIPQTPRIGPPSSPKPRPPSRKPIKCHQCNKWKSTSKCPVCGCSLCDPCWEADPLHQPGRPGMNHEKVDENVYRILEKAFHGTTPDEQTKRHKSDLHTTWFGVAKERNQLSLHYSNRLAEILYGSQTGEYPEQFPSIVSFVGQTGAGKSTVLKLLIERAKLPTEKEGDYATPVPGSVSGLTSTTGDVHLYSDPATCFSKTPILYADCEGMAGGENTPKGLACQEQTDIERRSTQFSRDKPIAWANTADLQSRQFAVETLFPRILYTFSDVVVFVLREARTFQTEVLKKLIDWAAVSIDKSINQPTLPHVVIVLNATDHDVDDTQWDPETMVQALLTNYEDAAKQIPSLHKLILDLASQGKHVSNTKDLLEHYYSSVSVVRIPRKGIYMKIDAQIGKIYQIITSKCRQSRDEKEKIRLLHSSQDLPVYLNAAYDHFSEKLDEPFDIMKVIIARTPPPKGFQGHVQNLILSTFIQGRLSHSQDDLVNRLFENLCPFIASCVILSIIRDKMQGKILDLFQSKYHGPLEAAVCQFLDLYLPCSFRKDGHQCCNLRNSHKKGHQARTGKMLARGSYQSQLEPKDFFKQWIKKVGMNVKAQETYLQQHAKKDDRLLISRVHEKVTYTFYQEVFSVSTLKSHLTCFFCVHRKPSHVLPCGHGLCNACARGFGLDKGDGLFVLNCCPLHPEETQKWPVPVQIRFKPEDAGVRVLSLDGGGVRGIVQLKILEAIEKQLWNRIPIQNFFDLIVGNGTGGIIALYLGIKRGTVADGIEWFKSFCNQAFVPYAIPFKHLALFAHKSFYQRAPMEAALKSAFDQELPLYGGAQRESSTSIRVAVTSTQAGENKPVVLSNYNNEVEDLNTSYKIVRPQDPAIELKVWEAARATAAAPPYFKPFVQLNTSATYVDGGIHHMCPIEVADGERQNLWKEVGRRDPDVLLSVGTGLDNSQTQTWAKGRQRGPSSLRYIFRGSNHTIDSQAKCEEEWGAYHAAVMSRTQRAEDRQRYARINVEFPNQRPEFDDLGSIGKMETFAATASLHDHMVREVAHRLVASSFYFESTNLTPPNKERGKFRCTGKIRCRFDEGSSDVKGLGHILRSLASDSHGFAPSFLLQEDYETPVQKNREILISDNTIDNMCREGIFQLSPDLVVSGKTQSSVTHISMRLQSEPYQNSNAPMEPLISISGFPRELCTQFRLSPLNLEDQSGADTESTKSRGSSSIAA